MGDESNSIPNILPQVAAGDADAMENCVDTFGPLVWSIVRKRVRDQTAAEDLIQDIFVELWKTAPRFDPTLGSETTFVAMIARRRAIDWVRKQEHSPKTEPLADHGGYSADRAPDGAGLDRETLWQALAVLPEETRRLLALHFERGMTHQEISDQTGLPLGSVKTRLRRGLIEARTTLQHLGAGLISLTLHLL